MTHTEDQDVVGINPEKLQALIGELTAAHRVIAAFAADFSAPLSALGISVNAVHQSEHWTSDQVSKLTERLRKFRDDDYSVPPRQPGAPGDPGSVDGSGGAGAPGTGGSGAASGTGGAGGAGGTGGTGGTGPAGESGAGARPGSGAAHGQHGHPGQAGAGARAGAGAGGGGGAGAAGYPAGGGAPYVPGSPGPPPSAAAHPAAHHAADVRQHATLAARRVSSDHPDLAARVWDDIERNASDPQYAAAFLAALGAAGLAVLGAAIVKRRKKSKDDRQAARRQATLDELTRAARQYEATAESFPVPVPGDPGEPAAPSDLRQEPGPGDQEAGPVPRLRLVAADPANREPGAQVPAAEGS